jgi:uncharacterized membrane protein YfcA
VLFDGLDGWHVLLLTAVYFTSYFIKGAIGTGNLAMMVLLGALILDPHHAVVLALGLTCFAQLQFLNEGIRYTEWKFARQLVILSYIGVTIGIWIFGSLDGTWLTIVLGGTLGVLTLADMTKVMANAARKIDFRRRSILYPTTILFGFISGVCGAGMLTSISLYLKQIATDARTLRGTILMLGILFAFWRLTLMWIAGFLTMNIVLEVMLFVLPMLYFGHLGTKCFHRMTDKRYYQYFQIILFCLAMTLVIKGILEIT